MTHRVAKVGISSKTVCRVFFFWVFFSGILFSGTFFTAFGYLIFFDNFQLALLPGRVANMGSFQQVFIFAGGGGLNVFIDDLLYYFLFPRGLRWYWRPTSSASGMVLGWRSNLHSRICISVRTLPRCVRLSVLRSCQFLTILTSKSFSRRRWANFGDSHRCTRLHLAGL